jgi:hypothetical protein
MPSASPLRLALAVTLLGFADAVFAQEGMSRLVSLRPALPPTDSYEALLPSSVRRLANGELIFADIRPVTVRLMEAKRPATRIVARQGAGPGEYRAAPDLLSYTADSVAAWDGALRRWSLLAPNGTYVRLLRDHEVGNPSEQRAVQVHDKALVFAASLEVGTAPKAEAITRIVQSSSAPDDGLIIRQSHSGHLWVAPKLSSTRWAVYDADGQKTVQFQFAIPLRLMWSDRQTVLGVTLDEDSVPTIVGGKLPTPLASGRTRLPVPGTVPAPTRATASNVETRLGHVLRGLVGPQEMVYAEKGQYTSNLTDLKRPASATEHVRFIDATKRGWLAIALDAATGVTCGMGVGLTPAGWNEAEPYCSASAGGQASSSDNAVAPRR